MALKSGKKGTPKSAARQHWADRIGVGRKTVKARAFTRLYPFDAHFAMVGGYNMHYADEGEGEPVVMLHGNPTWSFFYRDMILGLRDRFRCLAPDHIGMGFSDKPSSYEYTLQKHIDALERWLEIVLPPADWAGGTFNLVVHDWGGPIGMGYAIRNPARINRLVILNTSAFTSGVMPLAIRLCRTPLLGKLMTRGLNLFAGLAARKTTVKPLAPNVRAGFLLPYNTWANRVAIDRFVQDIPLVQGPTRTQLDIIGKTAPEALADKPVLVQWGMKDWCFTPAFLQLWRNAFPNAEVDEYPKAGHYLLEDEGGAIIPKVRAFLERP